MKIGQVVLLIINIVLIMTSIFNAFSNVLNTNTLALFLCITFIITYKYFGIEKSNKYYTKDIFFNTMIVCFLYTVVTYLLGFWLGFLKNPYNMNILKIIIRLTPIIVIIFMSELLRNILLHKGRKYKSIIVLTTISFILIDSTLLISIYDFSRNDKIIEFILFLMTIASKNIFLTYVSLKTNYIIPIFYRFYMELPIYIIFLFPNLSIYVKTILEFMLPIILIFSTYKEINKIKKPEKYVTDTTKMKRKIFMILFTTSIVIFIAITSGLFKYYSLIVGSNSMVPTFYRGDMIIIEKLSNEEIKELKIGDILVFNHDNIVVVHRIIKIEDKKYYTKGDNNNAPDNYYIREEEIIGVTNLTIKYIGLPVIWISDIINK